MPKCPFKPDLSCVPQGGRRGRGQQLRAGRRAELEPLREDPRRRDFRQRPRDLRHHYWHPAGAKRLNYLFAPH
jgi:hypothetical protein